MELLVPLTIACDVRREGKWQNHFILLLFFSLSTSPRANFLNSNSNFNRRRNLKLENAEKRKKIPIEIQVVAESVEYDDDDEKFTYKIRMSDWVSEASSKRIHPNTEFFSKNICEEIKVNEISKLFLVRAYWVIWFLCFWWHAWETHRKTLNILHI